MKKLFLILIFVTTNVFAADAPKIRAAHMPNVTHSQALVGKARGSFDQAFAGQATVEWKTFNAGPSIIEAIFANEIDIAYVGPNPTINGFLKSKGEALQIIAGSVSGGAAFVVQSDLDASSPEVFHGKTIATPQLGNTQDVALRHWLAEHNLKPREKGGDVAVQPLANPDQLALFLKKEIQGAWTVEPWVSRLVEEGKGKVFLEESSLWPQTQGQFVTTHVIVRKQFLKEHPELVKKWIETHVQLTDWINSHEKETLELLNNQLEKETGKKLMESVLQSAWKRLKVTYDPIVVSLNQSADYAFQAGFLGKQKPDLSGIYNLSLLNEILKQQGKKQIES